MLEIPIKIGRKEYFIQSDTANYMLGTYVKASKGEIQFKATHFFSNLQSLFNYVLNLRIRKSSAKSLEELREVIIKAEKDISAVWTRGVKKGEEE